MPKQLSDVVREYLKGIEGREVELSQLRKELKIDPKSPAFDGLRVLMLRLATENIVKPSGRKDGIYKVITQVNPIRVFDPNRQKIPPFELIFPRDFESMLEMNFAEDVVVREGDLVLIAGLSNYGKTTLALNFCGENIDKKPVLMGNEYTTIDNEPTPRFLNRLESMDWIEWVDQDGQDKFTLLPVREDYPEHIIKDRINIIDWINLSGEYYMISKVMEDIKRSLGKGVGILVIQKNEGLDYGRGGFMTKDFADCEILIDKFSENETLLKLGKVKESKKHLSGKTYAFGIIENGVKIINFREVKKCPKCFGKKYLHNGNKCEDCNATGYINS